MEEKNKKDKKKERLNPTSLHPLDIEDELTEILKIPIVKGKKITP